MFGLDIIYWLIHLLNYLRNKFLDLVDAGVPEVPEWYENVCGEFQATMAENMGWAGQILPMSQLAIAGGVVVTVLAATLGVRLTRMLISVKTGGGGA